MYNSDIFNAKGADILTDSPEISASPDRQAFLDQVVNDIHDKAGYGVTRVGDRLHIRTSENQIELVILEVKLQRDFDKQDECSQ